MDIFDNHENSSDSSISLASSVFTHDPDYSPYNSYLFDSDAPDDMDIDDDDDPQNWGPPTYASLMLENATVRFDADFFSATGWTTATVGSSGVSTSETRCPAPASVSPSISASAADLTASNAHRDLQAQEPRPSDSMSSPGPGPGPSSHVAAGHTSDIPINADSLFNQNTNYGYTFVVQDDQGLCGIGAWADIATSPFVAKKKRITPRQ